RRVEPGHLHGGAEPDSEEPGVGDQPLPHPVGPAVGGPPTHGRALRLAPPAGHRGDHRLGRGRDRPPLLQVDTHAFLLSAGWSASIPACCEPTAGAPSTSPAGPRSWPFSTARPTPSTTAEPPTGSGPPWRPGSGPWPRGPTGWTSAGSRAGPAPRSRKRRSWTG